MLTMRANPQKKSKDSKKLKVIISRFMRHNFYHKDENSADCGTQMQFMFSSVKTREKSLLNDLNKKLKILDVLTQTLRKYDCK